MYVYKYSVDIYLLCMIKIRVRCILVVFGECFKIDRSVVVVLSPPPLYFVSENSKNTRIELPHPIMVFNIYKFTTCEIISDSQKPNLIL